MSKLIAVLLSIIVIAVSFIAYKVNDCYCKATVVCCNQPQEKGYSQDSSITKVKTKLTSTRKRIHAGKLKIHKSDERVREEATSDNAADETETTSVSDGDRYEESNSSTESQVVDKGNSGVTVNPGPNSPRYQKVSPDKGNQ